MKSHWIDGFLKYLYRFFFLQKPRKSKNALYYQKNLRFLCEIDQKVSIFVEKLKKMQPLKMTFRSQLEPSFKSYECFMFLLNFRLEMTLDWWILERPKSFFSFKNRERVKMNSIIKKTYNFSAKLIKKCRFLLKNSKKCNLQKWPLEVK